MGSSSSANSCVIHNHAYECTFSERLLGQKRLECFLECTWLLGLLNSPIASQLCGEHHQPLT